VDEWVRVGADVVAIAVLAFGLYFPRHHRRDLVAALLSVNVGVLAVAIVLGSTTVGMGLGLGLFGVLSIIRLRSYEIAQTDIAYYFSALAIGLLAGLPATVSGLTAGLMVLVIATLFIGDHPRLFRRHQVQTIRLDAAYTDQDELRAHLEVLLGCRVLNLSVRQVDLVNDSTLVEVCHIAARPKAAQALGPDVERVTA
jgi:hypothetical protein